jgi:hypothetical protein
MKMREELLKSNQKTLKTLPLKSLNTGERIMNLIKSLNALIKTVKSFMVQT